MFEFHVLDHFLRGLCLAQSHKPQMMKFNFWDIKSISIPRKKACSRSTTSSCGQRRPIAPNSCAPGTPRSSWIRTWPGGWPRTITTAPRELLIAGWTVSRCQPAAGTRPRPSAWTSRAESAKRWTWRRLASGSAAQTAARRGCMPAGPTACLTSRRKEREPENDDSFAAAWPRFDGVKKGML